MRDIGENARPATTPELARLRRFFVDVVLPNVPVDLLMEKYDAHVVSGGEWPEDTSPEEYFESLRATVSNRGGGVYFAREPVLETWTVFFIARSGSSRGAGGGSHIVVVFNGERGILVTGFQPARGERYLTRLGGFWARKPS